MNKTTPILMGIIGAALVVGLIVFGTTRDTSTPSTNSTSTASDTTNDDATPPQNAQPTAPAVVTNGTATPSDTTAVVTGRVTPNGTFTNYWYEYGSTSNLGNKTPNQGLGSSYISIPSPGYITGLVKNTTYFFRLVAENQYGRNVGAQYSFVTTQGNPAPVGRAPTTKTSAANSVSRTNATLNGDVTPNQATTQYWFEYGRTKNLGNTTALTSAGNSNNKMSVSKSIANLDPATIYYFRLNAQNQFGTVSGETLNFQTDGPAAGTAPSANTGSITNLGTTTVTLRGTVDPNRDETTYWFEYSTDSLLGSVLLQSTEKKSAGSGSSDVSVNANVVGLSPNTTYFFRMVAQNSHGTDRGDRATFKTK